MSMSQGMKNDGTEQIEARIGLQKGLNEGKTIERRSEPDHDVTRAGVTMAPKYPYFRTIHDERSRYQSGDGRAGFHEASNPTKNRRYDVDTNTWMADVPEYQFSNSARLPRTEISRFYQVAKS